MDELYITVTGLKYYFGIMPFLLGTELTLIEEPENEYDKTAIAVFCERYGKVGYVANSKATKAEGTSSASSICGIVGSGKEAVVRFIAGEYVIAKVVV